MPHTSSHGPAGSQFHRMQGLCELRAELDASQQRKRVLETVLDTVFVGLAPTAAKYSPDGGDVTVRAWAQGAGLWCEVQDTGMGMSNDDQTEAFTEFVRARSAVQRSPDTQEELKIKAGTRSFLSKWLGV